MGLLDFKKPRHLHKNPAVRLVAISELDPSETGILAELSINDPDGEVRRAAIERISDPALLARLAEAVGPEEQPLLTARKDRLLYELVIESTDPATCREHLRKISAPSLLARIAVNHNLTEIRRDAVLEIDDQQVLAGILEQNCGKEPARAAMAKINDAELLRRLSQSAASKTARNLAAAALAELEQRKNRPSQSEIIRRTLTELAAEAGRLFDSPDPDQAAPRLDDLKQQWLELDPQGSHPDYAAFSKILADFAEKVREIEARRAEEREKAGEYEKLQTGLDEICATIERLTGSTGPEAESEKERMVLAWHSLLAETAGKATPSAAMLKRFATACEAFDATRLKIRREKERIEAVEENCRRLKELLDRGKFKEAGRCLTETEDMLAAIQFKYFNRAASRNLVSERAAELGQAERQVREQDLARRRKLCAELEKLAGAIDNRTEQRLKELRQTWQQLPPPGGCEAEELAGRFREALTALTGELQTFQAERDWQLWANLTLKEKLTEMVEALDGQDDLAKIFETVKEAQAEWKKIGPVPHKKSAKLWERFHAACERNFERSEPYLAEQRAKRAAAMDRRREICALAAELAESGEWRQTAETLKVLQQEWQTLTPGPRREEAKLYKQFRQACDRFFERRQENYRQLEEQRREHLQLKEKLCEEAERLAAEPQADFPKRFRDLQAEWKKIGPVPKADTEKVWNRFRAACDRYFAWLDQERQGNLAARKELCRQAEALLAGAEEGDGAQKEIATRLTDLQRQWKEIGPVPQGGSEEVWQRFRKGCDAFFDSRQQQVEKEHKERRLNQDRKEKLLAQAEELAAGATELADKKTAARLRELQKEWSESGAAPRETDRDLNERFKTLCDAFFEGHRQYFSELKAQQLENQKQKESLCLRLENILGAAHGSGGAKSRNKGLSLAEELKQAMEDNFMLAGRRDDKKAVHEEVQRIEQDWRKIGPVPYNQVKPLAARFKKALDQYYRSRR